LVEGGSGWVSGEVPGWVGGGGGLDNADPGEGIDWMFEVVGGMLAGLGSWLGWFGWIGEGTV